MGRQKPANSRLKSRECAGYLSKESTREITFEGRSDPGRREDPAVQNVRFAKNPVLIGSKSYFCSSQDCRFVI